MVMSAEMPDGGRVSVKEKDLAVEAFSHFKTAEFGKCLNCLEKLEILRPMDVKLAHNKIVAQCRADGSPVSLSEVVQQLDGLAKTAGLNLSEPGREDDPEWNILIYNLAVAKFQQRHILQASQLASRLLPLAANTSPSFSKKILILNAELSLALRQPELAMKQALQLENFVEGDADASRLMILKARCQVMARQIKSLKKELKSANLPGTLGVTCEFVRSHIEFQCGNHRKSIKMLNSAVQAGGNRVFPHYYNNLGCLHQIMKKPNLAVYYFKNALERLETSQPGGTLVPSSQTTEAGKESTTSWITQSQILYNISISLLHARRPPVAFQLLLEVVASHYLDPHVWFHLAECCIQHLHPDNEKRDLNPSQRAAEVSCGGVGVGLSHKIVASNPSESDSPTPAAVPDLSLDFAYVCLKNAESLLPQNESESEGGGFCEGVGYIGNPLTWSEVEQLRIAVLAAKAYVGLAVGDFILAGKYALTLLAKKSLSGGYKILGHLYAAESLILQDKLSDAIKHLDPENVSDVRLGAAGGGAEAVSSFPPGCWSASNISEGRAMIQYNLAVGFSLREEWDKAASLLSQMYDRNRDTSVHVLLLSLYVALRQGQVDRARQMVRERCPAVRPEPREG